jgi:hypothetical protein
MEQRLPGLVIDTSLAGIEAFEMRLLRVARLAGVGFDEARVSKEKHGLEDARDIIVLGLRAVAILGSVELG